MAKEQPERIIADVILDSLRKRYPTSCFMKNVVAYARLQSGQPCTFGLGKGSADIVGCHRGRSVWFEVKTPKGKQSDEQKAFEERITLAGGFYRLIRCWVDAERAIAELEEEIRREKV